MALVVVRCLGCGAGIDVQPDNLLMLCRFCGQVYPSKELRDISIRVIPSVSEGAVREAVVRHMATDQHMKGRRIRITGAEGVYVPMFVSRIMVQGSWAGLNHEVYGPMSRDSGPIDVSGDLPLLARTHAREFGVSRLGRVIHDQEPVPIEEIDWADSTLPVLAVDLDTEHANLMVKDEAINAIGERLKFGLRPGLRGLDAITAFDAEVTILDQSILLVPLWTVTYRHQGGSYRVGVAGGGAEVVAVMEPVFQKQRLRGLLRVWAAIVGTGLPPILLLAFLAFENELADEFGARVVAVVWVVLGLICISYAWESVKKLSASVKIAWLGSRS